ncbi:hypothetical protein LSAT2_009743 [Lamellibrachia satsuma]|nr:hypothetical protein LSAT2_009743 [Lamellibrachia satsuma]
MTANVSVEKRGSQGSWSPPEGFIPAVVGPPTADEERAKRRAVVENALSPIHYRHSLSESYEKPKSCREGWWRDTVRETPNPGHYESEHFLEELHRRPATYQFKSEGRKQDAQRYNRGAVLLPGAYNTQQDMSDRLEKSIQRYTFLDTDRSKQDFIMGCRDKEINVAPNAYRTEDHLAVHTEKLPSKDAAFKSQTARFPTKYFKPKEGPAPGMYEPNSPYLPRAISSSFISRTPRFKTSHTKVPGPGSYEKTLQYPQPAPVVEMGRDHGIFFTSDYRL